MITRHATGPGSWRIIMNFLAMIKAKLEKAARLREAQLAHLVYRGVSYTKVA
jgi:hypothetical protein